ncbi:hypothetical protein DASC09_005390 [Saccharomycopsis crataegensis]|uniref:Flavin-containing monooxygenase n=1 Tax=Saccharomycopsis crataegensis TaxID=43959 RepID=A0AAV5QEX2_9ASCO|nr:hypothetical protein DASC09_005390 [Saccharomycopsis crataegensis]
MDPLPSIKSIAIIGAGPAGLSAAYEFLHTSRDGEYSGSALPDLPAFEKIVIFEQQDDIGGIWNTKIDHPDSGLPPKQFLASGTYHDADQIHPQNWEQLDSDHQKIIEHADESHPIITTHIDDTLQWSRSAVYDGLFTNVPKPFLRFSMFENDDLQHNDGFESEINPLANYKKLSATLHKFSDTYDLRKLVRFLTQVESISKKDSQWELVLRRYNQTSNKDEWYSEKFDAVLVASGHYSVPFVPFVPGLGEYELAYPDSIIHNKAWRSPEPYRGKNVLFVGGSLSSIDILQYVAPVANKTYISRRNYGTPEKTPAVFPWLDRAAETKGIINKPGISKFDTENKKIEFADGSIVDDIDKVIFSTGYHWHYPFLPKDNNGRQLVSISAGDSKSGSSTSRLEGLYQHIFAIDDPTLAFSGVKISSMKWLAIETSNVAIAGVWSGATKLPSKEIQRKWEEDLVGKTGNNLGFHYSPWNLLKQDFVDQVFPLATKGRKDPLAQWDNDVINEEFDKTSEVLEQTFHKFKNGEFTYQDSI